MPNAMTRGTAEICLAALDAVRDEQLVRWYVDANEQVPRDVGVLASEAVEQLEAALSDGG